MAVNKPTQIEPSNDDDGKPKRASLLERASGTFGFDRLIPAAVPAKLDSDKAKKFAPRRTIEVTPTPAPAPVPQRRASDAHTSTVPEPAVVPPADVEPDRPVVAFTGPKREIVRAMLREQGLIDPDGGAGIKD